MEQNFSTPFLFYNILWIPQTEWCLMVEILHQKKVEKHNGFAEKIPVLEEKIKVINRRLDDLEKK